MAIISSFTNGSLKPFNFETTNKKLQWIDIELENDKEIKNIPLLIKFFSIFPYFQLDYIVKHKRHHHPWMIDQQNSVYLKFQLANTSHSLNHHIIHVCFTKDFILTVHYKNRSLFEDFHYTQHPGLVDTPTILIGILNRFIDYTTQCVQDKLSIVNKIYDDVFDEGVNHTRSSVLKNKTKSISHAAHFITATQESIANIERLIDFILNDDRIISIFGKKYEEIKTHGTALLTGVNSLNTATSYLIQNLEYLSDTIMGLIGLRQNDIMKFLSIVATIVMPINLVFAFFSVQFSLPLSWYSGYGVMMGMAFVVFIGTVYYGRKMGILKAEKNN